MLVKVNQKHEHPNDQDSTQNMPNAANPALSRSAPYNGHLQPWIPLIENMKAADA